MNTIRSAVLLLLVPLFAACAASERRLDLAEIETRHLEQRMAFKAEQESFARENPVPRRLEVPGVGEVILHECALQGLEGEEVLRLHYTWFNSTGRTVRGARIRVVLRDPATGREWVDETSLRASFVQPFIADCSYTTWREIPTHGLHKLPSWEWRIEASPIEI